jgi:hypothetical protein
VKSVAERLGRMDHDVTVLAGEHGVERPREEVVGGVKAVSEFNECLGVIERSWVEKLIHICLFQMRQMLY